MGVRAMRSRRLNHIAQAMADYAMTVQRDTQVL